MAQPMKGQSRFANLVVRIRGVARSVGGVTKTRAGPSARRRRELADLVRNDSLFDEQWYLRTYPDVAEAKVDPATHFVETGWREGRDPGPDFATSAYLKANPDVARAGLNPLVHYIEFGKFEGRDISPRRRQERPAIMPARGFAKPAPVFRGEIRESKRPAWVRSYRLTEDQENLIRIEEISVGLAGDSPSRRRVEGDFIELRRLSGFEDAAQPRPAEPVGDSPFALIDAWHAGGGVLRTRWQATDPVIVRGYQHQAGGDGRLLLVAESLSESPLDFIDAHLDGPYFPILFVFADPRNRVLGTSLMPFPSLCRGGLHYAELIAACVQDQGAPNPIAFGLERASALFEIRRTGNGLIRELAVEATGGPNTGPLFQPDFQRWLGQVAGVSVEPSAGAGTAGPSTAARLRSTGGRLVVAADMVPTIGAITSVATNGVNKGAAFAPLLVASTDSSKPALLVELPAGTPLSVGAPAPGYGLVWPRIEPGELAGAGAIRFVPGSALSDAELLAPAMVLSSQLEADDDAEVCWVICAADWDNDELSEALEAVAVQSFGGTTSIAFAGVATDDVHDLARRLFRGRVTGHRNLSDALSATRAAFVGHLGPAVILHDSRTTGHFVTLLRGSSAASVSCVILSAEKKGKTSHVAISDAGTIADAGPASHPVEARELALKAWRSCYPLRRPPRDLWLARAEEARNWMSADQPLREDAIHLCTTFVTASYCRQRPRDGRALASPPPAAEDNSIRAGMVFG